MDYYGEFAVGTSGMNEIGSEDGEIKAALGETREEELHVDMQMIPLEHGVI